MSYKKPHKHEVAEQRFPVRLTVLASANPNDWTNEQTNRWLRANLGDEGYHVAPAVSMSGQKAFHIFLPTAFHAAALLLACPHLRLHSHIYEGPER
jgi:hypothetical protein